MNTSTTADLGTLALRYLAVTDSPRGWADCWRERAWARALLARCHAPRYRMRLEAVDDLETVTEMLETVEKGDTRG